ncbi:hypothetical protein G4B88_019909 [Cannabis sativa]|uniref:Uncharacterized protein n=1 Tax=Cannabis sativa TaxID=3483 RepID=A0A7J6HU34_CANSA|nr:hypothetical protein G4B88_019909 [Cannabis sativa]
MVELAEVNSNGDINNNDDGKCSYSRTSRDEAMNAAATKVQKVYKSYRTRRSLADCAVVVEELWWKALDFAALRRSSVSFFDSDKPETAISRWSRARTRAAKIDPRHRYGHNLHIYYNAWFESKSSQPFFYWLDVGDGKEVTLEKCPRTVLNLQCIKYLGPIERQAYEVIVESGKLLYKQSGCHVETDEGTKWIFVLSTSRKLYVAKKIKGIFQHSSFLAGAATIAAGRLVTHNGILQGIWSYSGHYRPTQENFMEIISYLEQHHVDLTNVKKCPMDDDVPPGNNNNNNLAKSESGNSLSVPNGLKRSNETKMELSMSSSSSKWCTGAGPRISCVREYPSRLQFDALQHLTISPRTRPNSILIPSPRPIPNFHLSSTLPHLGLPSPKTVYKRNKSKGFQEKGKKKWKLWRSASEGFGSSVKTGMKRTNMTTFEASVESLVSDDAFAAAMAAVVRAQPKDFKVVKREWAAIRIQAFFRGFLARQALRALRAVVRIQAIFRGRQVRKQAAVTLRCMQALVRVQARVRARSAKMSPEGQAVEKLLDENSFETDPIKHAEQGWCDSPGTVSEVKAKLHMRQNGAIKRERVIAYSLSQQKLRPNASPYARTKQPSKSVKHEKLVNNSDCSWLDRWMATKPWENRLMEDMPPEMSPFTRKVDEFSYSSSSGQDSVEVRRNNLTTRITAKPPPPSENQLNHLSSSLSSESHYDETSTSTSSRSATPPLVFRNRKVGNLEQISTRKPSYMNFTKSTEAKLRACKASSSPNAQRYKMEELQLQFNNMSMAFSNGDTRSSAGSIPPSGSLSKDLFPPMSRSRYYDGVRTRRQ